MKEPKNPLKMPPKKPGKAETEVARLLAERNRPSRTDEEMTVDIVDAITTMFQLLKGRDLSPPAVLDALEDMIDNGNSMGVSLEVFKTVHNRRKIKL